MAEQTLHAGTADAADVNPHGEHHVVPLHIYFKVFAALMVLLVVTIAAAAVDLGPLNIIIAMTIAVVKAVLVLLYFMHLRYSSRLVLFFALAALMWLIILFAIGFSDYMTRTWMPSPAAWSVPSG